MDKNRYLAPDIGRGFMLLLIAVAHAPLFHKLKEGANELSILDQFFKAFVVTFVDGRAFVMFSLLFGFGIALMVKRQLDKGLSVNESKRLLRRRSLFMILFGFIHLVFIGGADIIAFYGLAGLLIEGLIFKSERFKKKALFVIGVLSFLTISVGWWFLSLSQELSLEEANVNYLEMVIENAIAFPITVLVQLLFFPFLFVILLGVLVERKTWISHPEQHKLKLRRIALTGILISVIGASPLAATTVGLLNMSDELLAALHILQIVTGIAGGIGYTSLIALFGIAAPKLIPKITNWLTAVGRRSLTFYLYQEALLVLLLSPVAFGLGSKLGYTEIIITAIVIWITGVIIASFLENKRVPGPADALLRRLVNRF
ncbi:DUF418 domain-containing protein [Cytobacillus kochii]|uniref:DUF418 domain-containing protein n=1 Tax=Cytobacillus kochii TaxID=859143 RepID=UPI0027892BC3|nr:DUF418 domain-containing protein [Cytobacillus kochii]MDQ0186638.1 putative membrane protein YeiB [Cytobacillus kochii]